ncbi:MAG TPA: amino acid ABC transporter substrate-binding protein, partial [Thermodesulfobacteriota bacterium]|nr:amino acid ABC transporter substrate-binding protein [Thermodesulfobacteriota bacterium]
MRKEWVAAFFVSLALVSTAFGQGSATPSPATTPIKIGGSLPLTGLFSESTKWIKAAYDFWADDINKRGGLLGRPVKMIIYDDEGNVDKSVTYYERAITVDKVDLVCGGPPGTISVALMPTMEKHEKVFIGPGGQLKVFEQGFTYSFGSPPLIAEWAYISFAKPIDDLIPKADWPKSIAIFTMNNAIGVSARGNVIKAMEERGIKVVVDETYNVPLSDATPMVSKAKAKNAEVMCCLSNFDDGVMLMRSAKSMNYRPKLVMQQMASKVPAWMKELGEDGNNVLGNTYWAAGLPYSGNDKILEGAKERLGIPVPPDHFGQGYCWMYTLELAVKGAGTLDNRKIRDY